jgi:cytochrome c oxidase subunit 4
MAGHVIPKKTYFVVFAALLVLTALTTYAATVDLGPLNTVVALIIAMCKASLVALFFMHLRWSGRLTQIVAVAALFWLAILLTLTLNDYHSRQWTPAAEGWQAFTVQSDR